MPTANRTETPRRRGAEDVARLPKWAQQRIAVAERDRDHWKEIVEAGPEDSTAFLNGYPRMSLPGVGEGKPLGREARITFLIGDEWDDRIEVQHDEERNVLRVSCTKGRIVVTPSASNSIYVEQMDA